jgi:tRNA threonylcarbamoyl adenosine modification protein YeaZ
LNFLSIDSITVKPSVSLFVNNNHIDCYDNSASSSYLPDAINSILTENSTDISLLDYIAITIGPGSYTGIRVGLSIAQGIAFSLSIPLVPINTMDVLCSSVKTIDKKEKIIAFPAYNNNLFYFTLKGSSRSGEKLKNIESFKGKSIFGIQLDKYKDMINYNEVIFSSRVVGEYSIENYDSLRTENISRITPIYIDKFSVDKVDEG